MLLICFPFLEILIINILYKQMFQEDSYGSPHSSQRPHTLETNQQRNQRIKKNKNIRKEKVVLQRNRALQSDYQDRKQLTREQRKQLQKQKNRIAAQNSRDKQKKYLEDLEAKMNQMQKQLSSQLCRKCQASLSDHSTSQDEPHQQSHSFNYQITSGASTLEVQHSHINILNSERQFQDLPFIRDDSRNDLEWGNIGKYFCLILVVLSVALLSSSVEPTSMGVARPVARILTENREMCEKMSQQPKMMQGGSISPAMVSTLQNEKMKDWPFKLDSLEPQDKCKNTFWEHYLGEVKTQVSKSFDWNLVTCNSPNLVHVSTVYQRSINHLQDKWTFLITNPIVSQVQVDSNGGRNYRLDEVDYLDGVYQLIAEKVVFKKVVGQSCLN